MQAAEADAAAKKKKKKKMLTILSICAVIAAAGFIISEYIIPNRQYRAGEAAYQAGSYSEAFNFFTEAGDYQDAMEQAKKAAYSQGDVLFEKTDCVGAYEFYTSASGYSDADDKAAEAANIVGAEKLEYFNYSAAAAWFAKGGSSASEQYARNRDYALDKTTRWRSSDTNADSLPDNVYIFQTKLSDNYGILKATKNGWATKCEYEDIRYYPEYQMICCGDGKNYTLIDLTNDTVFEIANCTFVKPVAQNVLKYYSDNKLFGFVDRTGNILIEPTYNYCLEYSDGLLAVRCGDNWGYIDTTGKTVIGFEYQEAEPFYNGYAVVYMNARRIKENGIYVSYDDGYGVIDTTGKHIIEPQWKSLYASKNSIDNGVVTVGDGLKYGLIGLDGRVILSNTYDYIGTFSEDLCYVQRLRSAETYYPCTAAGWVDATGKTIIDLVALGYDGARDEDYTFINGVTPFSFWQRDFTSRDIRDAVINNKGEILWQSTRFSDSVYQNDNGSLRINKKTYDTENGRISLRVDSAGLNGSETIANTVFRRQWGKLYNYSDEGIALVALNSSDKNTYVSGLPPYGYVTIDDTILVEPVFTDAESFYNGYAAVCMDDKWGYIDTTGKYVVEPQYLSVENKVSTSGTAFVKVKDDEYAMIDMNGNTIHTGIKSYDCRSLSTGTTIIQGGDEWLSNWLIVDEKGERVF